MCVCEITFYIFLASKEEHISYHIVIAIILEMIRDLTGALKILKHTRNTILVAETAAFVNLNIDVWC